MTARHNIVQIASVVALAIAVCASLAHAAAPCAADGPATLADVRLGDHQGFTRVVFEFGPTCGAAATQRLPRFEMRYRRYPYRLEVDLLDVGTAAADFPKARADRSSVVTAVGIFGATGDGAGTRAVICLARPSRYRIQIFPDPLRLIFDLRRAREDNAPERVWAVRVDTDCADLSAFQRLGVEPSWLSLIPDAAGGTTLEAGAFADEDAASRRADVLAGLAIGAAVVARGPADLPRPWPEPATPPAH